MKEGEASLAIESAEVSLVRRSVHTEVTPLGKSRQRRRHRFCFIQRDETNAARLLRCSAWRRPLRLRKLGDDRRQRRWLRAWKPESSLRQRERLHGRRVHQRLVLRSEAGVREHVLRERNRLRLRFVRDAWQAVP